MIVPFFKFLSEWSGRYAPWTGLFAAIILYLRGLPDKNSHAAEKFNFVAGIIN